MAEQIDRIIWENVEKLLQEKGMTKADLARKMDIWPQELSTIKSGAQGIGKRKLARFAEALGVNEARLLITDTVPIPQLINKPIPVISSVHAGKFCEAVDNWPEGVSGEGEHVYSTEKTGPHAFGLIVKGDSMFPKFLEGDIVIVDPDRYRDNGCVCVVCVNNEVCLRVFFETENAIILKPENPKYPEIPIPKDSAIDFHIIGKVVDLRRRF